MGDNISLRAEPRPLTNADVREMLKRNSFYCKSYPWNEEYANDAGSFSNDFFDNRDGTVTDRATGLMWQKGQAPDYSRWEGTRPYIDSLNAEHFAGYTDWRLPTIEELGSLMTRERLNDDLYVSPVFSNRMWFWSCDPGGSGAGRNWTDSSFAWAINFDYGSLFCLEVSNAQDIRAVRTATIPPGRDFFNKHLDYVTRKNLTGLLSDQYCNDVELVTSNMQVKGKEAVREFLERRLDSYGELLSVHLNSFAESSDVILSSLTIETGKSGTVKAEAAWYLRDGKIWRHISMDVPEGSGKNGD